MEITAETIARDDCRVKIFARAGVGFDAVDVAACADRGIWVTRPPRRFRSEVRVR